MAYEVRYPASFNDYWEPISEEELEWSIRLYYGRDAEAMLSLLHGGHVIQTNEAMYREVRVQ